MRHFGDDTDVLRPELVKALDLESYVADGYRSAVAGVERLDGESDVEFRMSHLHLTRFVRILLDRRDRVSMAVGLESGCRSATTGSSSTSTTRPGR